MNREIRLDSPLEEIEALVRLAGDYVHPSEDLRPRVLETARVARRERRARRRICELAAVCFLAVLSAVGVENRPSPNAPRAAAWMTEVQAPAAAAEVRGDSGWDMVESFTELRSHQARVLRLAL
jgi:hypothetical protein